MKRLVLILLTVCLTAATARASFMGQFSGVLASYRAPQAPNAPTGVTATVGNTQNTVSWTAGATDGTHDPATSYTLYGGTSASPTSSIYSGSGTSYTHTGLTNGTPYYYRLTASNLGGTSGYSSPDATATPYAPPVYALNSTTLDTTHFGYLFMGTSSQGSSTNGAYATTGGVTLKTASATDAAIMYLKTPINTASVGTWRVRVSNASGVCWVGIYELGSTPTLPLVTGSHDPTKISAYIMNTPNYIAWTNSAGAIVNTEASHTAAYSTLYDYTFTLTSTNVTLTITKVSDGSVLATLTKLKSSMFAYSTGTTYLAVGDWSTSYTTNTTVVEVQTP